ncbi:MAG: hypothetical protein R3A13_07885 [Bdellovibrionota bacterium]
MSDSLLYEIIEAAGILDEELETLLLESLKIVPPSRYFTGVSEDLLASNNLWDLKLKEPLPVLFLRMLSVSNFAKNSKVLEIHPQTGFSTSILSSLGAYVFAVYQEVSQAQLVRKFLDSHGYQNALIRTGDSQRVWNEFAPFDCIFLYQPVEEVSFELLEMLSEDGGTLVVMLKEDSGVRLCTYTNTAEGLKTLPLEQIELQA